MTRMTRIFKGNILFTPTPEKFTVIPHGHILVSEKIYQKFIKEIWQQGTTRIVVFEPGI